MNAIPPFPAAARALTCSLSCVRTALSFHRAGTGRYAGLKVPMVCAHSPDRGCFTPLPSLRYGSAEAAADAAAPASAEPREPRGEMGDVPLGKASEEALGDDDEEEEEEAALLAASASAPPA